MEQTSKHELSCLLNGTRLLAGARVLIVEDDPLIALDVETILDEAGAEVSACRTVKDGLIAAAERELSAALLDYWIGDQTVEPVARLLAKRNIPFVFYTGQANTDAMRMAWPESKIIRKPARSQMIVQAIAALLDW